MICRYALFDDLNEALRVSIAPKSDAVLVATVIIGVAARVLNVADRIKPLYRKRPTEFAQRIMPRLSSGDQTLWDEFDFAVSLNRSGEPAKTVNKFR
jgi:hypothetical protein